MVFEAIAELVAERVEKDVSEITMDSKFQDLGIDSLDMVEMVMDLEEELGVELETDEKMTTVGELADFAESKAG